MKHPSETPFAGLRPAQLRLAAEVLTGILRGAQPADATLQNLFRAQRKLGARDRANVSGLVYGVLRALRRLRAALGESADPAALCAAHLASNGWTPQQLAALGIADAGNVIARVRALDDATLLPAVRVNLPDAIYERLLRQYGAEETESLALALNRPATVDLRVNTLRATREQALERLRAEGIEAEMTPLSPFGIRLGRRAALQATGVFRDGWVEPQDEASQLAALLTAPRPGETVVDLCAGAGGKTLALGALMENRGRLLAFDLSRARLSRLAPRARRAGLGIVRARAIRDENDAALARHAGQCDAVLVDAPCSGTGRLRRNPELRLRALDCAALQRSQGAILDAAARLVRSGGRLVYATCSVLAAENEDVIQRFLSGHPALFEEADAGSALSVQSVAYEGRRLKLLPHRHGTDGFFAALMIRQG